ncbi:uncharacterized protein PITG_11364 [Phytophthora infestans T30-4]|uniref:Uncharacterized protein n=1 Tax=Phytophthora infestans (strain T30-4) TaxID=403677 RepID=D0NIL9_PHYIT|nr:uncharacterized protein PITG_11364 [Phytophthora infestans T30-4]EEY59353.1 conserved hypothetical protein [Phytophthora infestans T30-4]|eukprot:XP_002900963.1 conserved hypothetical protein [Phytophthora infestans T30-4]
MSAGAVIGIIAGVLVLGVAGFFVYRYVNSQQQTDEKQFMQDYPNTPTEYDFTTLDAPSTKATPDPLASSIAMLHAVPGASPSPSQEPTRYNFDPAQSTVNGAAPSTSPFNKKDSVQASRPSNTNFDAHSMEFNAAPGSYAESYTESYAGSFAGSMAGSYANSFSGTYNGQGVLNSFDGSVDDFGRDTVGTTVSEALDRQSEVPDGEQSHWMDDMRGTNDSYAMLESGSFDRTSALSRFSTDSDLTGRPTQS